jgi:hypothetical protein
MKGYVCVCMYVWVWVCTCVCACVCCSCRRVLACACVCLRVRVCVRVCPCVWLIVYWMGVAGCGVTVGMVAVAEPPFSANVTYGLAAPLAWQVWYSLRRHTPHVHLHQGHQHR